MKGVPHKHEFLTVSKFREKIAEYFMVALDEIMK
jgi:hypothetical protein